MSRRRPRDLITYVSGIAALILMWTDGLHGSTFWFVVAIAFTILMVGAVVSELQRR